MFREELTTVVAARVNKIMNSLLLSCTCSVCDLWMWTTLVMVFKVISFKLAKLANAR